MALTNLETIVISVFLSGVVSFAIAEYRLRRKRTLEATKDVTDWKREVRDELYRINQEARYFQKSVELKPVPFADKLQNHSNNLYSLTGRAPKSVDQNLTNKIEEYSEYLSTGANFIKAIENEESVDGIMKMIDLLEDSSSGEDEIWQELRLVLHAVDKDQKEKIDVLPFDEIAESYMRNSICDGIQQYTEYIVNKM